MNRLVILLFLFLSSCTYIRPPDSISTSPFINSSTCNDIPSCMYSIDGFSFLLNGV